VNSDLIFRYFPELSARQKEQFEELGELYRFWNARINVVSRKDIDSLYLHHVLHSLSIAKVLQFLPGEKVMDVGTGGGFPGIPLAILFPETQFHLVDSIGKKIRVVTEVAQGAKIENVKASHARAEQISDKFNFIISRAVTQLKEFYPWVRGKFEKTSLNVMPNGVLYLKGGDLEAEIRESGLKHVEQLPVTRFFQEEFFDSKYVIYFPAQ
jgi:16S rRNA (guanine527-N7)-methyltransferase